MNSLYRIGDELGVPIGEPIKELGSAKGAYYHTFNNSKCKGQIGLNSRNSELQNIRTLIHELARAKLRHGKKRLSFPVRKMNFKRR